MKEPDRLKFIKVMFDKVMGQMANVNFVIFKPSVVPEGTQILPLVQQMKRKRHIATHEVYKFMARCNIIRSKLIQDKDYDLTHSPVAGFASIRIDYVLAYSQAEIDHVLYMEIPKGFEVVGDLGDYVLEGKKNVYGQKQAGLAWNKHLVARLKEVVLTQCRADP
jgi:Reverse transcriptase (RNA-dependent DNA polymerase)